MNTEYLIAAATALIGAVYLIIGCQNVTHSKSNDFMIAALYAIISLVELIAIYNEAAAVRNI